MLKLLLQLDALAPIGLTFKIFQLKLSWEEKQEKLYCRDMESCILAADYSQIELRIIADFSGDKEMIKAFREEKDIHSITASKVFNVDLNDVTKDMRRRAKEVNFGIIYGISPFGLSQNLNISRAEAKEIIDSYFNQFKNVKKYMDNSIELAREKNMFLLFLDEEDTLET